MSDFEKWWNASPYSEINSTLGVVIEGYAKEAYLAGQASAEQRVVNSLTDDLTLKKMHFALLRKEHRELQARVSELEWELEWERDEHLRSWNRVVEENLKLKAQAGEPDCTTKRMLVRIHDALDGHLGDTDPYFPDDMTDEEIREENPVFWVAKEIAVLIGDGSWDQYTTPSTPAAEPAKPVCFGLDDCSSHALSVCSVRDECGKADK